MFPFKTILVPTDYSVASGSALSLARDLAPEGARLIGLHVLEPPQYGGKFNVPGPPPASFRDHLDRWLKQDCGHDAKLSVESRVADGPAWEEILRVAGECHCDLIVMGSEGKTGMGRTLLGSVAEQVSRHALCPVLVCKASTELKPGPASGQGERSPFSTILFPTDLSDRAGEAFGFASALAGARARLIVQHVVEDADHTDSEAKAALIQRLHTLYPAGSVGSVVYRLSAGNPVEEIRRAAEDSHCDLIVMNSRGRGGMGRLLMGSVAESVFRNVRVPVVIIHGATPESALKPEATHA